MEMKVQALAGLLSPGPNNAPLSAIGGVDAVLAITITMQRSTAAYFALELGRRVNSFSNSA